MATQKNTPQRGCWEYTNTPQRGCWEYTYIYVGEANRPFGSSCQNPEDQIAQLGKQG